MTPMRRANCLFAVLMLLLSFGCSADEPLRVTDIQLGRSLNVDNSIASHATLFSRGDTVYASVLTAGTGEGTLSARWLFGGQTASEATKDVSYREPRATEFRIQNALGFPPGDYAVEISLNGEAAGRREFRVQK